MSSFPGLRHLLVPATASKEEVQPIMTPVEHSEDQPQGSRRNNGMEMGPTNYNSVRESPSGGGASALRDPDGGYVGPAATTTPAVVDHGRDPNHQTTYPKNYNNNNSPNNYGNPNQPQDDSLWGWCEAGSRSERRLVMVVLVQMMVLIAMVVVLLILVAGEEDSRHTCTSHHCYMAVGEILESLDESVSPCEDFSRYVCDGWRRRHPLPEAKQRWGVFDNVNEVTLLDVRGLLEEEGKQDEPKVFSAVRTVYKACINDTQWQQVGLQPLLSLLQEHGGLPMLDPWWSPPPEYANPLLTQATHRRTLSGLYLINLLVQPDNLHTEKNVIYLSPGMLPLRRDYLEDPEDHRSICVGYMRRTGELLLRETGHRTNRTFLDTLNQDIDDLWDFDVKMANITPKDTGRDPWKDYNPMTLRELQNITDAANSTLKISWVEYIREIFSATNLTSTITSDLRVVVTSSSFLTHLLLLLQDTPPRIIMNYLLFPLVTDMGEETSPKMFYSTPRLRSLGRLSTRAWYDCTKKVKNLLPFAVGALYVRQRARKDINTMAGEVVSDVTSAFRSALSWMDKATREEALKKIDNMGHLVAYPAMSLNDTLLDDYYKGMPELSQSDHFGNMMALTRWHCHRSLMLLVQPLPHHSWPRGPLEVNAFYSPQRNSIVIPMAVLQSPIFIPERITSLNYGSLGAIIGHEVTHGFDNTGRMRDWAGGLKHWWSNDTLNHYHERAQCFSDQYSGYDAANLLPPHLREGEHLQLDGERTKGENIADNGGLRAAWAGYRRRVELDMEEGRTILKLPGLDHLTQDQLFFIGFGKVWCNHLTPFALRYLLNSDVHTPAVYRILGTLQNAPEFATAFQCAPNATMNPDKKCILW